jgi:hypothetical protein
MKFRIFKSEVLRRFTKLIGYVNFFIIYSKIIKNKKNDNFLIPPPPRFVDENFWEITNIH